MNLPVASTDFSIGPYPIGVGAPCLVIAEIGSNHNQDLDRAHRLIGEAARAGAQAVKFQSIQMDRLYVPAAVDDDRRALFAQIEFKESWHTVLQAAAADEGLLFLSSPTYFEAVELLDSIGVPAIKIASPQAATDPLLVERAARTGRPIILSTGYLDWPGIDRVVEICRGAGNTKVVLLHCVAEYPVDPALAQLRALPRLAERYGLPIGLSDHTMGVLAAPLAVALGATVIEKHLTLDRTLPGPDHAFALEPREFAEMAARIREAEVLMGDGQRRPTAGEQERAERLRQFAVAATDLEVGALLRRESVVARRGATGGIDLWDLPALIGRPLRRRVEAGVPLRLDDIS